MIEALLSVVVASVISLVFFWKVRRRIYEEIGQHVYESLVERLGDEENQEAIQTYMGSVADAVLVRFKGMLGGLESGVSRNLKKLEGDLVQEGVTMATGNPYVGAMAQKYLKKYPVLGMFLPQLMKGGIPALGAPQPPKGSKPGLGEI